MIYKVDRDRISFNKLSRLSPLKLSIVDVYHRGLLIDVIIKHDSDDKWRLMYRGKGIFGAGKHYQFDDINQAKKFIIESAKRLNL